MEKYLYFAETDVETGDDQNSEACLVPASNFLKCAPSGDNSVLLTFKNGDGNNGSRIAISFTLATADNYKNFVNRLMEIIYGPVHSDGFVVVADFETGTAKSSNVHANFGGDVTDVQISEVVFGTISGTSGGTTTATVYGAGFLGTNGAPQYSRTRVADEIVTSIKLDMTGLGHANDADDAIGLAAGGAAYFYKTNAAENGLIFKAEMVTLEAPTAASNNTTDIDIWESSSATIEYNGDLSGQNKLLDSSGIALLDNDTVTAPSNGRYLYLAAGNAPGGAGVFTGGQVIIKLYGHAAFQAE